MVTTKKPATKTAEKSSKTTKASEKAVAKTEKVTVKTSTNKPAAKAPAKASVAKTSVARNTGKYTFAVGRRKSATASIKLFPNGKGNYVIVKGENTIPLKQYFLGHDHLIHEMMLPFSILGNDSINRFDAEIRVLSGGKAGQADSIKLGFARALVEYSPEVRAQLKPYELLKRDPRSKERKKPGLKKARKGPKWSKR